MVDAFPSCKDVQSAIGAGIKTRICVANGQPSLLIVRISMNHSNRILILCVGWFFYALQILTNRWFPNYQINMIFSNILSLGSFISQHRSLETLWGQLHYTLTSSSRFLNQNKPIWEDRIFNGHLSITDTILRSRWCPL